MLKFVLIFVFGVIETFIYTWYLIAVNKGKPLSSSITLTIYMTAYLLILNTALKDNVNGVALIIVYALSNGIGNYLKMITEKKK